MAEVTAALPAYALAPVCGYLAAGTLKFLVNSIRARGAAVGHIGLGGFPSTHTTIVCSTLFLVGLRAGWGGPEFGICLTLAIVVVIDAMDLRRRIGDHAAAINRLRLGRSADGAPAQAGPAVSSSRAAQLRERIGHKPFEVAGGVALGLACAAAIDRLC